MRQVEGTLPRQRKNGPLTAGVPEPIGHLTEILERISKLKWLPIRHWFDLREAMGLRVTVRDPEDGERYRFTSDSLHSYQRARALFSKEPETIGWLRANLCPSDVFLDIGANVGTFSIFAAKHLSQAGHVFACEPHLPTTKDRDPDRCRHEELALGSGEAKVGTGGGSARRIGNAARFYAHM